MYSIVYNRDTSQHITNHSPCLAITAILVITTDTTGASQEDIQDPMEASLAILTLHKEAPLDAMTGSPVIRDTSPVYQVAKEAQAAVGEAPKDNLT